MSPYPNFGLLLAMAACLPCINAQSAAPKPLVRPAGEFFQDEPVDGRFVALEVEDVEVRHDAVLVQVPVNALRQRCDR